MVQVRVGEAPWWFKSSHPHRSALQAFSHPGCSPSPCSVRERFVYGFFNLGLGIVKHLHPFISEQTAWHPEIDDLRRLWELLCPAERAERSWCAECHRDAVRHWRDRNRDEINRARREAYGATKPHCYPEKRASPRPAA